MSSSETLLDVDRLRELLGPGGPWACACGSRIREQRQRALGMSLEGAATRAGTTLQTLARVERGEIVPRDYLRAAIAVSLHCEVHDLWRPLSQLELRERASR